MDTLNGTLDGLRRLAADEPGLRLLVLFGSRARGDHRNASDWDFGYIAGTNFDLLTARLRLCEFLETDDVDLVDLARAGAVLRHRVAAEGLCIFEASRDEFAEFQIEALSFWFDNKNVIQRAQRELLNELGP